MIGIEIIKYSLANLWHRKSRSFLTIFSIFIGITTIFIFISFGWGLYQYMGDMTSGSSADKVLIQPKGASAPGLDATFALDDKDLRVVEKTAGVYEATGTIFRAAEVKQDKKTKYTFLVGYDPDKPLLMEMYDGIGLKKGRWLQKSDNGKVILGYNYLLKNKIFPNSYDLGKKIIINGKELQIVGFLESVGSPPDDAQIYTTNDYMYELYPENNLSYGWIVARVDITDIEKVVDNIEKNLRNRRDLKEGKEDFFVQSFDDMIESFASALNIMIGFIVLIAFISVIVSAVNTSNTMITSVLERIREIGVMKAIGARNSDIFYIFLFESGFLGFVSGVIGVFFGWILTDFAGNLLVSLGWGFLSPHYSWELFAGCILFATITGAISGVIPAIQASKTNIVEALRYE